MADRIVCDVWEFVRLEDADDEGKGWVPQWTADEYDERTQWVASVDADGPFFYLFGWRDGEPGVWRQDYNPGVDTFRPLPEPVELANPRQSPYEVELVGLATGRIIRARFRYEQEGPSDVSVAATAGAVSTLAALVEGATVELDRWLAADAPKLDAGQFPAALAAQVQALADDWTPKTPEALCRLVIADPSIAHEEDHGTYSSEPFQLLYAAVRWRIHSALVAHLQPEAVDADR